MRKILSILFLVFIFTTNAQVGDIISKQPTNYVNDYANMFSSTEEGILNSMIKQYEDSTSIQIAVVTTDSLFDSDVELKDYSDRLGQKWGVGSKELDNGILILIDIFPKVHNGKHGLWAISVGYGLEGLYPDVISKRFAEQYFPPNFREQKYFKGVQEFLKATMNEIGYEGYAQLIEKERIAEEQRKEHNKEVLIFFLYILGIGAFMGLIIYLIVLAVRKRKRYIELRNRISVIHDDIMLRKTDLVKTLGKVPTNLQDSYDKATEDYKVTEEYYNQLVDVKNAISEHQNLIKSTNNVITNILSEEKSIKEHVGRSYPFCEKYLKDELNSFIPDTRTNLFTSTEFTNDRYFELKNLNNSLSSKLNAFLKKTYTINDIVNTSSNIDGKVKEFNESYEDYKKGKKYLLTLPIGKRVSDLAKVDIEKYISDTQSEISKSFSSLEQNDYKTASYHYGIYLTLVSVLSSSFMGVSNLISSYKRSDTYVDKHKKDIETKLEDIKNKIGKSGVKSSRSTTLDTIKAKINKFNNNIAFDIILAASLLKEILKELDDLYNDIKKDIEKKKKDDQKKSSYSSPTYKPPSYSSPSSNSGFGGFGGGSFGGGGSRGSW